MIGLETCVGANLSPLSHPWSQKDRDRVFFSPLNFKKVFTPVFTGRQVFSALASICQTEGLKNL